MVIRKWSGAYLPNFRLWVTEGISVIHARIMIWLNCVVSFIEVGVKDKRYERNPQCLEASLQLHSCRGPVENLFCHIWCEPDLNLRINKSINTFSLLPLLELISAVFGRRWGSILDKSPVNK